MSLYHWYPVKIKLTDMEKKIICVFKICVKSVIKSAVLIFFIFRKKIYKIADLI